MLPESIKKIKNLINIYFVEGDMMVGSKKIGDISNSNFNGNVNFQSDNNNQSFINGNLQLYINELENDINSILDGDLRETASKEFQLLVSYIKEKQPSKIKGSLIALNGILQGSAAIISIASYLGITL